jgi:polysaccharide pyruvyl transferase WcaK-like protein
VSARALAWPEGRPRVLVSDCWPTNAGDAAIALATDGLVRRLAPGAAVVHAAYHADQAAALYPELRWAEPLESLVGTRWAGPAPGLAVSGPAFVAGADLVISQGGGFLHEAYQPWARIDALARAADAGVPLVIFGQTIGDLRLAFARRAMAGLLRSARLVIVRDPSSRLHVLSLGADPDRVMLGTDAALALAEPPAPGGARPAGPVDVVLGGEPLPASPRARGPLASALLAAVACRLPGERLRVWSSVQGDDATVAAAVAALPREARGRVDMVAGHVDARRMAALAGGGAAMAAMRFHPALLAAAQGVPTVVLLDDAKADALTGFGPGVAVVRGARPADAERAAALIRDVRVAEVGPGPRERLAAMDAALAGVLAGLPAGIVKDPAQAHAGGRERVRTEPATPR